MQAESWITGRLLRSSGYDYTTHFQCIRGKSVMCLFSPGSPASFCIQQRESSPNPPMPWRDSSKASVFHQITSCMSDMALLAHCTCWQQCITRRPSSFGWPLLLPKSTEVWPPVLPLPGVRSVSHREGSKLNAMKCCKMNCFMLNTHGKEVYTLQSLWTANCFKMLKGRNVLKLYGQNPWFCTQW